MQEAVMKVAVDDEFYCLVDCINRKTQRHIMFFNTSHHRDSFFYRFMEQAIAITAAGLPLTVRQFDRTIEVPGGGILMFEALSPSDARNGRFERYLGITVHKVETLEHVEAPHIEAWFKHRIR